ncbi:putative Zn-dependent peptidase [Hydrogenivirga caldilitoris]|uniref:Putative Zn-dependent peptidase n=1 Tax=Hydrogenivirga caldilitoris TaxID=246264 RepID=A0A497XMY7_9AQUI|nr:pitrilysin family protein [Hydrogenivirga caldilitoris]RLJ70285.1 putative Zn-dependent peptidase [Hydrogenivirga caldilitoris]
MTRLLILLFAIVGFAVGGSNVVEKTLPNGVTLIVKETKGKGIVSAVIFFKGGQYGEKLKGETHLLLTLLIKGSKNYPSSYDVSLPFESQGGYIYTSSGDDFSELGFSTRAEKLEEALKVVRDVIENPLLKEEDIEREKKNTLVAIRSKRERGMEFAMEHMRKLTYRGTPYETTPLGTEESVSAVSREDLLRRLEELRKGGNIVVSLVGDIHKGKALKLLEETFYNLKPGVMSIEEKDNPITKEEVVRVKREGTQATILCALNAPQKGTADYYSFKVLTSALGDGMTSKLFVELREKKGYAYATYAFYPTKLSSPRLFAYIGTSPEKKENALEDLLRVVRNPKLTEEDIELAKNKIVGDFLLDHQTRLRQAWYLGFYEVMGLGWETDKSYPERIRKVSLKDVEKSVEKYINKYHCVVVEP